MAVVSVWGKVVTVQYLDPLIPKAVMSGFGGALGSVGQAVEHAAISQVLNQQRFLEVQGSHNQIPNKAGAEDPSMRPPYTSHIWRMTSLNL